MPAVACGVRSRGYVSTERIDNDTWDLATSVGATATIVATGRARVTNTELIDDPFAEPLVRPCGRGRLR
jgi:O-methyltransferase involved in polyketide biosynthesis